VLNSRDFVVFWQTARYVLSGEPAYSVTRDGAWVFKYPPWILPLFLPFGLLSLEVAKVFWGLLQVGAFAYVVNWVANVCGNSRWHYATVFLFWGLWQVNAQDGQITLLLLALFLWAGGRDSLESMSLKSISLVALSFAKVFTAYPLLACLSSRRVAWQFVKISTLVLAPLSLPALWVTQNRSLRVLVHSYVEAVLSGGKLLGYDGVRGRYNQGLIGFFLRLLQVPAEKTSADVLVFLLLGSFLALIWHRLSRTLSFKYRWVGWIGLTPVVHPLPFWYSFVLTFPLASISLSSAMKSESRISKLLAAVGVVMITALTSKSLGSFGVVLELLSIKSWGVLFCCVALILGQQKPQEYSQGTDLNFRGVALNGLNVC
jgi:hypothetical protein